MAGILDPAVVIHLRVSVPLWPSRTRERCRRVAAPPPATSALIHAPGIGEAPNARIYAVKSAIYKIQTQAALISETQTGAIDATLNRC